MRLENLADPSLIGSGGWSVVAARNNVGLRNVSVQIATGGDAVMRFNVVGSAEEDSLTLYAGEFDETIDLVIPVQALPWRDMKMIESAKQRRLPFGYDQGDDPLATMKRVLDGGEIELMNPLAACCAAFRWPTDRRREPEMRPRERSKATAS